MDSREPSDQAHARETFGAGARADASGEVPTVSLRSPFLRIFSSQDGCSEFDLTADRTIIGRSEESDVRFDDTMVSRKHAVITREGDRFLLKDLGSYQGTTVNGQTIRRHRLEHGDSIGISTHVLQFRVNTVENIAARVVKKARRLLQGQFHLLPSSMALRYRFFGSAPEHIFTSGDTLVVGQGGLLIPARDPPDHVVCLELGLTWPNGREKRLLGEILGVMPDEGMDWMCVKIHRGSKEILKTLLESGTPGEWIPVRIWAARDQPQASGHGPGARVVPRRT